MAALRVASPTTNNGIDFEFSRTLSPSPTRGSPSRGSPSTGTGSPTAGAATLPRARSRTPNARRSPTKCACCPYGYHIDVDFVRFCDALAAAAAGRSPGAAAEKARRRPRRRQRQSMEVLLGVATPDTWNIDNLPQLQVEATPSEHVSTPSPRASVMVRDALSRAVKDFEDMLQKTTPNQAPPLAFPAPFPLEPPPPPPSRRYDSRSSFLTPPLTPDTTVVSQNNRSPVASPPPPPPPPRANGTATAHIDSCTFLPHEGATYGLSASALQNIREQMAKSLERMRELEDQVKVIPVLQVQLSVLKEEKRKMLLELRGPQHKINNLNNNINIQDGDKKEVLRIDENDLKVRKHCCNFEKTAPPVQVKREASVAVGVTVKTRDVGVSPPRNRVRTVATNTTKSPKTASPSPPPSPSPTLLIDNTSVVTDLLMHQIYTEDDLQRRIDEAIRSYESSRLASRVSQGVQVAVARIDGSQQTEQEKRVDASVSAAPRLIDAGVSAVPRTRDYAAECCFECEKCSVKRRSVAVGGSPGGRDDLMSLSLNDLGVSRSKSFELAESPVKKSSTRSFGCGTDKEELAVKKASTRSVACGTERPESPKKPSVRSFGCGTERSESPKKPSTRSFGCSTDKKSSRSFACGTSDLYVPRLNRGTNTDAPAAVPRKEVGVATIKATLVDAGVEADLNPRPAEIHTCDKCSAVIKGLATDVVNRSRDAEGESAAPRTESRTESRIPRFTGSSQTSPSPSMTSSLNLGSPGSAQRKFMRQDTYTKIPKSCPESPKGSASQRKSSSSPTKASVASTAERSEERWSDSEESVQDVSMSMSVSVSEPETPDRPPETNQLFKPIHNEKRVKSEPSKEMKAAIKVLHDSLEKNLRLQQGAVPPHLRSAYNVVQQEWFKVSSTKNANPFEVEDYLDDFEEKSPKLLEYIVNITDNSGNTAMHYAVSHGNFDVVSILLDSKVCHVDVCNAAGYTSVMLVSLADIRSDTHKHVVKRLLKLADVNSRGKQHGQTALMLAVSHGRLDTVGLLLEAGADINIQDEDGSTALMCAAEHGHLEIVKLLLAQPDCDVTIVDYDGSTALTIAMEADHRDIGVLLYAQQHFSRGSSPYASLKSRRSKSVTPTMRSSATPAATPPPIRRTPTTPTSPLPSHKPKFNQSL